MAQTKIKAKKPHLTDDQREAILEEYHASELSAKAFCESKSISYTTLKNWLRRQELPTQTPTGFVQLAVADKPQVVSPTIEVIFPSGVVVRLGGTVTAAFVNALVSDWPC
jgi:DNA-binding transcriptional regulator YiaG